MSPRTKEQFAAIRKQSSTLIAEKALGLFAKHGFHNTSIGQIAKAAGVSKGLIYNYFDTKEELLRHIIVSAVEMGDHLVEDVKKIDLDPLGKIFKIIDDLFGQLKQNPKYWKLIYMLSMQEEIAKKYEEVINQHAAKNLSELAAVLKELNVPNCEQEAMILAATFDGMLLHFLHMGDQYPLDELREFLKKKIGTLAKK